MKRSRFTEEQIIGVLREQETGSTTADVCRKHGASPARLTNGSPSSAGLRSPTLEAENARLKKLPAEAMLDNAMLKDVAGKNGDARREARGRGAPA